MRYQDFLRRAVEESIIAATEDFAKHNEKRYVIEGSLAGLRACLDLSPPQLKNLLARAYRVHQASFHKTSIARYWRVTSFMHEVEWICNVVSVVLWNQGIDTIVVPTQRAAILAQRITLEGGN